MSQAGLEHLFEHYLSDIEKIFAKHGKGKDWYGNGYEPLKRDIALYMMMRNADDLEKIDKLFSETEEK